jgi:hypothetical protein
MPKSSAAIVRVLVRLPLISPLKYFKRGQDGSEPSKKKLGLDFESVVEDPIPTLEDPIPTLEDPIPALEDPIPALEDPIPALEDPIPALEDPIPALEDPIPALSASVVEGVSSNDFNSVVADSKESITLDNFELSIILFYV